MYSPLLYGMIFQGPFVSIFVIRNNWEVNHEGGWNLDSQTWRPKAVHLHLECAHLNLIKNADLESVGLGYSSIFCVSNRLPGVASVAGLWATLWRARIKGSPLNLGQRPFPSGFIWIAFPYDWHLLSTLGVCSFPRSFHRSFILFL